jgi:uncharacterized membrane protein YcaP (DUF421 family)
MNMLFDGWESIGRAVLSGSITYVALVLMLHVSGKRTLAKMNAFDLVVTVALGSTVATIALSRDVSVATWIAGLAVLIGMQCAVAWLSVGSETYAGQCGRNPDIHAVILETDGSISIVLSVESSAHAMHPVRGREHA